MANALTTEPLPLVEGTDAVIRVGGTRVTLETVVGAFTDGATAEEIAQQYPSVALADVYQVIGYYLRHSTELSSYFARRQRDSNETRRAKNRIGRRTVSGTAFLPVAGADFALVGGRELQ